MAAIRTAIELQDNFTGILYQVIDSVNIGLSAMEDLHQTMNVPVDTASIEAARNSINQATVAVQQLDSAMQGIQTPTAEMPDIPNSTAAVELPIHWQTNTMDVFTDTGTGRFEQEIQSANNMLNTLNQTQSRIAATAAQTDLFPASAIADMSNMESRLQAIQQRIQAIESNPVNLTSPVANTELEQLRGQLNRAVQEQQNLNSAVNNMDVQSANNAYLQLSHTIDNTERYIRDNIDAQGRFNREIQEGANKSNKLMQAVKGAVTAYAVIQAAGQAINLSDQLVSTTARLDMIVDDGGSVEDLQNKIFASAESARASYTDTMDTISKLGLVAGDAFSNNDELIKFSELINKNFVVGGASATEQASAMYQLTQAMGSGRLQGDEYRSIIENAPLLAESIEDYMRNVQGATGTMKDWASEGLLTADVIKSATFQAAGEIEERFSSMPRTFEQIWTSFKNHALMAFQPILQRMNEIANSEAFQNFVNGAIEALSVVAGLALEIFNLLVSVAGAVADNWSWLAPIIYGVAGALVAYYTALGIYNTIQAISNGLKAWAAFQEKVHAASLAMETGATFAATAAQYGLNAALYACPITWIIVLIIALIALFYAAVAAVNHFAGTSVSATGIITGAFSAAGAFIYNMFAQLWNIISAFVEFFANVWDHPEYAIKALVVNLLNTVLNSYLSVVQGNGEMIGAVVGAWLWCMQSGNNVTAAIYNFFAMCIENVVNSWNMGIYQIQIMLHKIAAAALRVAENIAGSFDAVATGIANAFISGANKAIESINWIIDALNMIPGINFGKMGLMSEVQITGATDFVSRVQNALPEVTQPEHFALERKEYGSLDEAYNLGNQIGQQFASEMEGNIADIQARMQSWLGDKPEDYWEAPKLDYMNLGDAARTGYNWGAGIEAKLSGLGNIPNPGDYAGLSNYGGGLAGDVGDIAGNTGKMADSMDVTEEELMYLRDLAERDVINRFTTAELKVDFTSNNNIKSDLDIDGVIDRFEEKVSEIMEAAAEGVYS